MREEERRSEEVPQKFLRFSPPPPPPRLFLALLLSLSFSSSSSQIVLTDRSTAGKWRGYKDTHTYTHAATHKGRAQSTRVGYRGQY